MGRYRLASHNTTTTMKPFVALSALLAAATCQVAYPYTGYPYAAYAPYNAGSQFHAQDEFGNLNYGYTNINSVKQEVGNTYGGATFNPEPLVAPVFDGVAPEPVQDTP